MRRIAKAVVSIAAVTTALSVAGCGSDDSDSASTPTTTTATTTAPAAAASGQAKPAATGDTYKDTCNSTVSYINQMIDTGLAPKGASRESLGKDSLDAVKKSTLWSSMNADAQKDYQRGVEAAIKGKC